MYISLADENTFSEMKESLTQYYGYGPHGDKEYYVAETKDNCKDHVPHVKNDTWWKTARDPVTGDLLKLDFEVYDKDTNRTLYSEFRNTKTGELYYYQGAIGTDIESQIQSDRREIESRLHIKEHTLPEKDVDVTKTSNTLKREENEIGI